VRPANYRSQKRHNAKKQIYELYENRHRAYVIHYSSEGFDVENNSPRIVAIAIRNLQYGTTTSFSIHQIAEREKIPYHQINQSYNLLEKKLLQEFYQFIKTHKNELWLHWEMRNGKYGFPALANRYKICGGKGIPSIHEDNLYNLSQLLLDWYGEGYVPHPRLASLINANFEQADFLTGQQEAEAFNRGEFAKIHASTLAKVDFFAAILDKMRSGELKTKAKWHNIYGADAIAWFEAINDHWVTRSLGLIGLIIGMIAAIDQLI
jgi:hypothetical protein